MCPAARRVRPGLRLALTIWWRGTEFDRRLAAGEDPGATDALALRASRLTTVRHRTLVADGLAGALRSAEQPRAAFTAAVRTDCSGVLEAGAIIAAIERRLRSRRPVAARGMALIRLLLIDGNGPLYRPSDSDALGSQLRAAAAALDAPSAGD